MSEPQAPAEVNRSKPFAIITEAFQTAAQTDEERIVANAEVKLLAQMLQSFDRLLSTSREEITREGNPNPSTQEILAYLRQKKVINVRPITLASGQIIDFIDFIMVPAGRAEVFPAQYAQRVLRNLGVFQTGEDIQTLKRHLPPYAYGTNPYYDPYQNQVNNLRTKIDDLYVNTRGNYNLQAPFSLSMSPYTFNRLLQGSKDNP